MLRYILLITPYLTCLNGAKHELLLHNTLASLSPDSMRNTLQDLSINEFNDACMFGALQDFVGVCLTQGFENVPYDLKMETTVSMCLCEFQQVFTPNDYKSGISDVLEHCKNPSTLDFPMSECIHHMKMYPQTWMTYTTIYNKLSTICRDFSMPFERVQMVKFMNGMKVELNEFIQSEHTRSNKDLLKELNIYKNQVIDKIDKMKTDITEKNQMLWEKFNSKNKKFETDLQLNHQKLKANLKTHNNIIERDLSMIKANFISKLSMVETTLEKVNTLTHKHDHYFQMAKDTIQMSNALIKYASNYFYLLPFVLLIMWYCRLEMLICTFVSVVLRYKFEVSWENVLIVGLLIYCARFITKIAKFVNLTTIINTTSMLYGILLVQESYTYVSIYYLSFFVFYNHFQLNSSKRKSVMISFVMLAFTTITLSLLFYKVI